MPPATLTSGGKLQEANFHKAIETIKRFIRQLIEVSLVNNACGQKGSPETVNGQTISQMLGNNPLFRILESKVFWLKM